MYKIYLSEYFLKQLEPLLKKYRHLDDDVECLLNNFNQEMSVALGANLYKLRLKSSDIKKGSQKAFRLIIFLYQSKQGLIPVNVYFKGDKESIDKEEIKLHLRKVLEELKNKKDF